MRRPVCAAVLTAVAVWTGWIPLSHAKTRIIAHGWDLIDATPGNVLANADKFAETGISGVALKMVAKQSDGTTLSFDRVMDNPAWPRAAFTNQLDTFRRITGKAGLTDSFVCAWWSPQKRLAWTDDAAWSRFAASMGTLSWFAKEGGLRGVLLDPEDYPKSGQFFLKPEDGDFDAAAGLARRRGAQVAAEMFRAFPDMTLLSFHFLTLKVSYLFEPNALAAARKGGYLWPWFVNGMLDVMPLTVEFVEGNEHAYVYSAERGDFFRSACEQHTAALGLVFPENRAKYRACVRAGFGLYLDSYLAKPGADYYQPPLNGSRLARFALNLEQAARAADGYVWLYGEVRAFVKWQGMGPSVFKKIGSWNGVETWNEKFPGFNDEMKAITDPVGFARQLAMRLSVRGVTNIVSSLARPYPTWKADEKARGGFSTEGDRAIVTGPVRGCHLLQIDRVKPGQRYVVQVRRSNEKGDAVVAWKKSGKWRFQLPFYPISFDCAGRGAALVRVPAGADSLVVQLNATLAEDERTVFDELQVLPWRD